MDCLERSVAEIEAAVPLAVGAPEAVATRCAELGDLLAVERDPGRKQRTLERLAALLSRRSGPGAGALFDFVEREARRSSSAGKTLPRLLEAADEALRTRALGLVVELAREGRLAVTVALMNQVALRDETEPWTPRALQAARELVERLPAAGRVAEGANDRTSDLFRGGPSLRLRRLAARILDAEGRRPDTGIVAERLGPEVASLLVPYLEHSRATHCDLVDVTASPGCAPAFLDGFRRAEATLGPALLREVVGRLGWSRFTCGLSAEACVGMSVGGSLPFVVAPAFARLLADAGAQAAWRRHVIIAHGGPPGAEPSRGADEVVGRFRRYNLTHAELLDQLLAVAPLDEAKTRRVLALMQRVVDDFAALFGAASEDARRIADFYERLCVLVEADLARDRPAGALCGETVRRVQMFEDPHRLDDVTTIHGLKRYLHQQGLRLAFRLFRAESAANRTVDLLVAGERDVLRCEQVIRYLEFEPTEAVGSARLPFVVSLLAAALGRQLLHGRKIPWVTILGYGNEQQVYVSYRNHPAFIRIDLSPPLRGGMVDLEFFAVSQYELDQHPDLSLPAIQRVLRELEFDVSRDGLRLHARYDKERARDLGDVVAKVRMLFDLLPYLMDLDWTVGDLDHPPAARPEVAGAWASFFARWGVVPSGEVVSETTRKIVVGVEPGPTGPREAVWDGRGRYRDRFSGTPPEELAGVLHGALGRLGLSTAARAPASFGQRALEEDVLRPLEEAVERGEIRATPSGLERAPEELFQRDHEAERLAAVLVEGGAPLARAARMAALVRGIERQVRFRGTGSVQGYAVEAARLPTAPWAIGLFALRDAEGVIRLALAARGGVLWRTRAAAGASWRHEGELEVAELAKGLRAYNYLGAGPQDGSRSDEVALEELRRRFSERSPTPVPRQSADDRVIPATVAAPGRATGFARFHAPGRRPDEVDGGVLVARSVTPEDAPLVRHAAGIISTGGGVLSHVGLIALELGKPALIVEGRWCPTPSGEEVLLVRRPLWREVESRIGDLAVVCRHELRDAEEALAPGDLVTIDGEASSLVVLGHDPQALALHHGLYQLEAASAALAAARTDGEILAGRGRLIRAAHGLERLLARVDRGTLVRHAVRELLTMPRGPSAPEGRQLRTQLLGTVLRNPACEGEARLAGSRWVDGLRARLGAARRTTVLDVPRLAHPSEVLFARLGVRRAQELLHGAVDLLQLRGRAADADGVEDVDAACEERLAAIRAAYRARAARCQAIPGERWRLRHLALRLAQLAEVLGEGRPGAEHASLASRLAREDEVRVRACAGRRVIGSAECGLELRTLVGGKAAHLGEIGRALGGTAVPPWFVVGDAAFREALAARVPPSALDAALRVDGAASLEEAISRVVAHAEWSARRQAIAVRELWRATPLPAAIAEDVSAAYASLAAGDALAPVAIRSSACEEDAEGAAWAGQFDTFLFVRGVDAVLEHLKLAWAGFWTERAIDQRRLLGAAAGSRGGGVVVQRMVDARASGVLHTVHVAAGRLREIVVNAGLGLGEGVVSGTVEVDHVLVSKDGDLESGELDLRCRVGDKREQIVWDVERGVGTRRRETLYHQRLRPALEYVELLELVRDASRLEDAFLEPLDVEFAVEGRGLRILQARPVPVFDAVLRETLARHPLRANPAPERKEAT